MATAQHAVQGLDALHDLTERLITQAGYESLIVDLEFVPLLDGRQEVTAQARVHWHPGRPDHRLVVGQGSDVAGSGGGISRAKVAALCDLLTQLGAQVTWTPVDG